MSGSVPAAYTNSTQVLVINGGGLTITAANVACNLVGFAVGHPIKFTANLAITGLPVNPMEIATP